jgi:hypothetical protein
MKRGETVSASVRAERARESAKQAIARELLYAGILARLWPSYVMQSNRKSDDGWFILAVESPAGWLWWKLSPDERQAFEWLPEREHDGQIVKDRTPTLMALALDGW